MHVVIPVADDDKRRPELEVALATIRRYTDLVPVTVGRDFGLCDLHIPTRQLHGGHNRHVNVTTALRAAIDADWITDPFVWSNSDIYWLRPAEPILWATGHLEDARTSTVWDRGKRASARILTDHNRPTWDYESHTPLTLDKATARESLNLAAGPALAAWRSIYGNLAADTPDLVAPDVKLFGASQPVPDAPWASTQGDPRKYPNLMKTLNDAGL